MTQYRLVLQTRRCTWGSEGLEWTERYYLLQSREAFNRVGDGKLVETAWSTIPTVEYEKLSIEEREETLRAHGMVKNEQGYWRPKE